MEARSLRRSARLCKQVKTYNEDENAQDDVEILAKPAKRKRSNLTTAAHVLETSSCPVIKDEEGGTDHPGVEWADKNLQGKVGEAAHPSTSVQLFSQPAKGSLISGGNDGTSKQPKIHRIDNELNFSIKKEVPGTGDTAEPLVKASKRAGHRVRDSDSAQLYGHPAEGTLISWGANRTRKQPKIYPVPTRIRMPIQKENDGQWMATAASAKIAKQRSSIPKLKPGQIETRLRSYQDRMPSWYTTFLQRADTERMFVLNRSRNFEDNCHAHHDDCPYEILQVAGSSGNVYTVTISHLTSCTCPVGIFSRKGDEKQCKHVLYVLYHVLKAPEHLTYQPAFLTSELKELFANAPPLPTEVVEDEPKDGNRKAVEGDCPICFMDFEDDQEIVWCKAACGNNIHKECFDQWARANVRVTCPFCRSEWQSKAKNPSKTNILPIQMPTEIGPGGYHNVYDQLMFADETT